MNSKLNLLLLLFFITTVNSFAVETITLKGDNLELQWNERADGLYTLHKMIMHSEDGNSENIINRACQTVLYSATDPNTIPAEKSDGVDNHWLKAISPIVLNRIGERNEITTYRLISKNPLTFSAETDFGTVTLQWTIAGNEIYVKQLFKAKTDGYYSLSTVDIFNAKENEIKWATIPGYVNSNTVSDKFYTAYIYGHYIPNSPIIYQDKCVTTPVAILSKNSMTVGVTPEKEYPRKPHDKTKNTHMDWNVGFSLMNLQNKISPTIYYPVLGQKNSFVKANNYVMFEYRYIVAPNDDWYSVMKQVIYNVYDFKKTNIVRNKQSLTSRVLKMYKYLTNIKTSRFRLSEYEGVTIGAQDYLGGVAGSKGDAMKNSDYGAMWMLGTLTQDTLLLDDVLPYARNFKIMQQYTDNGPFRGAIKGQYYLWKSKTWMEEWGPHIEPIGVTYYAISDLANILLFNPTDSEAKKNLRLAADYLLKVQKKDGSLDVGIDKNTKEVIYPDLQDLRPTFYGPMIAYQVLKDKKYLNAAIKGADWFVENAVNKGRFIGVCGDTRLAPDFATAQSAQILLDLYKLTNVEKYKEAAIQTAKYYTTYIYTYPNGQTELQVQNGEILPGWAFSQSGLCYEHAGAIGSATVRGPILLASFAGLFVRLFELTNDSLYIDMARAAVNGKDAFVDPKTSVASYYWDSFNQGSGPFPHHAWWQIGWIMDYLVAEAELRSNGQISFPRGFITPKVGPHKSLGFAPGKINGEKAELILSDNLIKTDNPACEYLIAKTVNKYQVVLMNSCVDTISVNIDFNNSKSYHRIEPYGIKIIELSVL